MPDTPGTYLGVPIGATTGPSGEKNTPCCAVKFKVTHRATGGEWEPVTEMERAVYLYFTKAAKQNSKDKLTALGFGGIFRSPTFSAKSTMLHCKNEEWPIGSGKFNSKWELPKPNGGDVQADDALCRELDADWRATQATPAPAAPTTPAPVSTGAPAPIDTTDHGQGPMDGPPY